MRILILLILFVLFAVVLTKASALLPGATYYVDCIGGDDRNNGRTPEQAWLSMDKANGADLRPGDRLLFKRGCAWSTRLEAWWSGTRLKPILIGAYGSGNLPVIQNGSEQNVRITGSYLILENLRVHSDPLQVDSGCKNQPYGYYQVGFSFLDGSAHNTLRYSQASGQTAGIKIAYKSHHNKILHNILSDNHVLQVLDRDNPDNDIGAWGILVNGSDNEFAYNSFSNNHAWCSYDYGHTGNSIELFGARRNIIHHNISKGDETFSELGSTRELRSENNVFAYNLFVSSISRARFLIVRGEKDANYGPTLRTTAVHNTVFLTGPFSQGVVCGAGCGADILILQNNILWAEEKAAFADAPFIESHNIYWDSDETPHVQYLGFDPDFMSMKINPRFMDTEKGDFRLGPTSPAIDAAVRVAWERAGRLSWSRLLANDQQPNQDLGGVTVPTGPGPDIGAYEFSIEVNLLFSGEPY